jgi:hypothetical protein
MFVRNNVKKYIMYTCSILYFMWTKREEKLLCFWSKKKDKVMFR